LNILVDADACPVKEIIIKLAMVHKIPVTMICDTSHKIEDGYSTVLVVDKARDSVDIALINRVVKGDIVVTQDYGVATMALAKGTRVLNQNGMIYTNDNIDRLLFERFLGQKVRRSGGRTSPHQKRKKEDDESFEKALLKIILES
jgi:uncharacterized protein YaiI (UPF0178 family)